ncbi:MAG: hypothetical protein ACI8S6_001819 [Myxococcota bacterium]|jgi:hypothetical protein
MDRATLRSLRQELGALALLLIFPAALLLRAGGRALGAYSFDQAGHLWAMWHATVEPLTTTMLLNHPAGLDLMPTLGGWADIVLGALLSTTVPLEVSYNLVIGLYLWLAGAGAYALSRVLGAGPAAAVVAGFMLQTEPLLLRHAGHGQVEQVGLGVLALAVAGAIYCWRTPSWPAAVATGLAGAAVVFISWEYAALLAGMMLALTPGIVWTGRDRKAWGRWGLAAGTTLLIAGPWALSFLLRTSGVRTGDDDGFNLINAAAHSLPLLDWFRYRPHLGPLLLSPLLLVPWTAERRDRRVWLAAWVGLMAAAALAAGPDPRLLGPPPQLPQPQSWAPFTIAQSLPVLGWFHWPDRIMSVWPLAAAPATALLLHRIAGRQRLLAVALGLGVIVLCGQEAIRSSPKGRYQLPGDPALVQLATLSGSGSVLDLPVGQAPQSVLRYQLAQVRHGRPLPLHSFLTHLHYGEPGVLRSRVVSWSQAVNGPPPSEADFRALVEHGVGFVTLHRPWLRGPQYGRARSVLEEHLGEPVLESAQWACWRLSPP